MKELGDPEDGADGLKDLGFVALTDLHAILHGGDDMLRAILSASLGALFCRPWYDDESLESV